MRSGALVPTRWLWPMLGLFALAALTGCEDEVTAVLGTDKSFTMYGVLTPEADTQWVRVYEIENRLQPIEDAPIDANLTSEDLTTGQTRTWSDSVITEPDGRSAHAFWSTFQAEYGHTYRVTVEGTGESRQTRVSAQVPDSSRIELGEVRSLGAVSQPVFVRGDVPRLSQIKVIYEVKFAEGELSSTTRRITVSYDGAQERIDGGWRFLISLSSDFDEVRREMEERGFYDPGYGLRLMEMQINLLAVNDAWHAPGGEFDAELLVQPGTMSNVEDGFGFVGAGYRLTHEYLPDEEHLQEAGFSSL